MDSPGYVIASKPHDGGPSVYGPYTLQEATDILQRCVNNFGGEFQQTTGYWSDLPSWFPSNSEDAYCVVKINDVDFEQNQQEIHDEDLV